MKTAPPAPLRDPNANPSLAVAEARKRRSEPAPHALHLLARLASRVVFGLLLGFRVIGRQHVPRSGPLIVVGNHLSFLEPPLVTGIVPRRVTFLALYDLFDIRGLAIVLRLMGALPVKRGGARDLDAVRVALDLLRRNEAVGIYPEGTRSLTPGLLRANPGVSLLALKSGATILPIAVTGTERLTRLQDITLARWRYPRVRIAIGRPFTVGPASGRPNHQAIADAIVTEVAALLPAAYRGVYAERPPTTDHVTIAYLETHDDDERLSR